MGPLQKKANLDSRDISKAVVQSTEVSDTKVTSFDEQGSWALEEREDDELYCLLDYFATRSSLLGQIENEWVAA